MGTISRSIWGSFKGWGSFRRLYIDLSIERENLNQKLIAPIFFFSDAS